VLRILCRGRDSHLVDNMGADGTQERRKPSIRGAKRAQYRRKQKRKRRALEAVHESCKALTARRILRDCEFAIRNVPSGSVGQIQWRHGWFAAVALLRAVGHGLRNEDAGRSQYLNEAIEATWQRWKTNFYSSQIFHGFIEDERNTLLKKYEFVNERKVYTIRSDGVEGAAHDHLVLIDGRVVTPDAALRVALDWWRSEINRIERHAANLREVDVTADRSGMASLRALPPG
jgi:hypothetical protein